MYSQFARFLARICVITEIWYPSVSFPLDTELLLRSSGHFYHKNRAKKPLAEHSFGAKKDINHFGGNQDKVGVNPLLQG